MNSETVSFTCEKHGKIGQQVLKVAVYKDENKQYETSTFCGLCHYDMLKAHCRIVEQEMLIDSTKLNRVIHDS